MRWTRVSVLSSAGARCWSLSEVSLGLKIIVVLRTGSRAEHTGPAARDISDLAPGRPAAWTLQHVPLRCVCTVELTSCYPTGDGGGLQAERGLQAFVTITTAFASACAYS